MTNFLLLIKVQNVLKSFEEVAANLPEEIRKGNNGLNHFGLKLHVHHLIVLILLMYKIFCVILV